MSEEHSKKRKNPAWLKALVRAGIAKAGNQKRLGDVLEVSHTAVGDWIDPKKNAEPKIGVVAKLIEYTGGDIEAALPGHKSNEVIPRVPVSGFIEFGQIQALNSGGKRSIAICMDTWEGTPLFELTMGKPVLFEVRGTTMMPVFGPRDVVVCRMPVDTSMLPSGTPVITAHGTGDNITRELRTLRRTPDGIILATPSASQQEYVTMRGRHIELVVIGRIEVEARSMSVKITRRVVTPPPAGVEIAAGGGEEMSFPTVTTPLPRERE